MVVSKPVPKPATKPLNTSSKIIETYWRRHLIPGISVAAAYRGDIVLNVVHGYRSGPRPSAVRPKDSAFTPANDKTHFRIASVSKPVTAVVAMRMVQRKELELDRSVASYLDDFWYRKGHGPTVRELLSHTGGVRAYAGRKKKDTKRYEDKRFSDLRDVVPLLSESGMIDGPGKRYFYSTHGYTILGAVMVEASGLSFPELIRRELRTLGDHRPHCDGAIIGRSPIMSKIWKERKVKGRQDRIHAKYKMADADCLQWKWPGGGMHSTSIGLCHFASQLLDGTLLAEDSLEEMWTPQPLWNGKINPNNYGLGWGVGKGRPRLIAHSGAQLGAQAHLRIDRDRKLVVAILSNRRDHPVRSLAVELLSRLRAEHGPQPRPKSSVKTRPKSPITARPKRLVKT